MSDPKEKKTVVPPEEAKVEPKPEPIPTPEELADKAQEFGAAFGFGEKKVKDKKKEEPAKVVETTEPSPEPEKPKAKAPTKAELAAANAEMAERLKKLEERSTPTDIPADPEGDPQPELHRKKEPQVEEPISLDLDEEDQEILDAVKVLERDKRNAGSSKKLVEFWEKEAGYLKRWQAKHPGEEFDKDDAEHAALYDTEPQFDEAALRKAKSTAKQEKFDNAVSSKVEEYAKKNIEPELKKNRQSEDLKKTAPKMMAAGQRGVALLASELSDDFKKIVNTENGPVITEDAIKKMTETDPVLFDLLTENAEKVDIALQEITKIEELPYLRLDGSLEVTLGNKEDFKPHQFIFDNIRLLEKRLLAKPKADQMHEGKQFMPGEEFNARWHKATPVDRKKLENAYWTPTAEDIRRFIVYEEGRKIRDFVAKANSIAERKAKGKTPSTEPGNENNRIEKPIATSQNRSPSTVSVADNQDNSRQAITDTKEKDDKFSAAFFG